MGSFGALRVNRILVILPQTPGEGAAIVAARLRRALGEKFFISATSFESSQTPDIGSYLRLLKSDHLRVLRGD
jgi:hypothetical protein